LNKSQLIIKSPSEALFAFNEVKLDQIFIESIRPSARFLFSAVDRLLLDATGLTGKKPLQLVATTIDQFASLSKQRINYIALSANASDLATSTELNAYNIRSLEVKGKCPEIKKINLDKFYALEQFEAVNYDDKLSILHPLDSYRRLTTMKIEDRIDRAYFVKCKHDFEHLTELELSSSVLKTLEPCILAHFSQLVKLSFIYTQLTVIKPGSFANLTRLTELTISGMKVLKKDTFLGLASLRTLTIESCDKTESGAFNGLDDLYTFKFEGNLKYVAADAFDSLANLDVLDLSGNCELTEFRTKCTPRHFLAKSSRINPVIFNAEDLSPIEEIEIHMGHLNVVDTRVMFNFRQSDVRRLDLSWNNCVKLGAHAFECTKQLTKLNLEGNTLTEVANSVFDELVHLQELQLTLASLKPVQRGGLFKNLRALRSLKIHCDTSNCFVYTVLLFWRVFTYIHTILQNIT
jgi:Leucine-rich repeat (LRR) protein